MIGMIPAEQAALAIKPFIELRTRYERRTDRDFDESNLDNRSAIVNRLRIGADLTYGKNLSGKLQYRYGHEWIWTEAKNHSKERSDLELAYVDYTSQGNTARLGRQFVAKGAQLLVSTATFGNVPYAWDGLRYTTKQWDAFLGEAGVDPGAEHSAKWIGFAAHKWKLGETMVLWHQREAPVDDVEVYTLDHRFVGQYSGYTVEAEAAVQTGQNAGKDVQAWAGRTKVSRKLNPTATAYIDGYVASGGSNADKVFTFDMVSGSVHALFGQMDLVGWRNIMGITLGVGFKPNAKLDYCLEYHRFGLYDGTDAWYGAGGGANKGASGVFRDPTGQSGRDLGQEFNFTGNYKLAPEWTINFGVGLFQPGEFVKSFSPGDSKDQFFGYLGFTTRL